MTELNPTAIVTAIMVTWGIGLAPPLLLRYVILKRPMEKWPAIGTCAFFWFFNFFLFTILSGKIEPRGALILVSAVSYWILRKTSAAKATPGIPGFPGPTATHENRPSITPSVAQRLTPVRKQALAWFLALTAAAVIVLAGSYAYLRENIPTDHSESRAGQIGFDFAGARKAGVTDAEIVDYLCGEEVMPRKIVGYNPFTNEPEEYDFDCAGARKAGVSDREIVEFLDSKTILGTPQKENRSAFDRLWSRTLSIVSSLYVVLALGIAATVLRRKAKQAEDGIPESSATKPAQDDLKQIFEQYRKDIAERPTAEPLSLNSGDELKPAFDLYRTVPDTLAESSEATLITGPAPLSAEGMAGLKQIFEQARHPNESEQDREIRTRQAHGQPEYVDLDNIRAEPNLGDISEFNQMLRTNNLASTGPATTDGDQHATALPTNGTHGSANKATPATDYHATIDEDHVYHQIAEELETGATDKGMWTRLFAECGGDEKQTKVLYIKQRADRLISAERLRLERAVRERAAEVERVEKLRPPPSEAQLMEEYGITFDGERYAYGEYKYDRLADAISYAKLQKRRSI